MCDDYGNALADKFLRDIQLLPRCRRSGGQNTPAIWCRICGLKRCWRCAGTKKAAGVIRLAVSELGDEGALVLGIARVSRVVACMAARDRYNPQRFPHPLQCRSGEIGRRS